VTPSRAELAEDTAVHLLPRPAFEAVDRGDYFFEASAHRCAVHRVRLGDVAAAVEWTRAEAQERNAPRLEWWVGWSATPTGLGEQLLVHGLVPDDEEAILTGMTCDAPTPAAPHVDVRRIETLDQQLEALHVDWEVWNLDAADRARRASAERRRFTAGGPVHHFAAYEDGRPVGFGRAIDMAGGVAMMGGAVLEEARGRGVYRALVHARWEHAAGRGTPLLVVQAGHMSAPVLVELGFERHGDLRLFMDPAVRSGHGDD
jgi:GNAT superfamily N-acetyltransferase